ncbi:MAG: M15 family metallopeptidase [Lachnospiraceae bacterium]|nr:M15 family metallopeptidase [Lachnospiraceae bacterium]
MKNRKMTKELLLLTSMATGLLGLGACGFDTPKDAIEEPEVEIVSMEIPAESEPEVKLEADWLQVDGLDFAMKIPKGMANLADAQEDQNVIFLGENESLTIELREWDQVSDPGEEALAELVRQVTGEATKIVECGGRKLIQVDWPHGDVNYYLLASNGDAYELWITPYVMKDPEVYEKVRAIVESFGAQAKQEGDEGVVSAQLPKRAEMDYLVLVNKKTPLPEDWEEKLDLVITVNSVGDVVPVERTAYKAYLELKKELMEEEGIDVDLDSAYRSVQYQQDILDRFTEKYGAAYAARTVAKPGYSEHHTGLALDLYFRYDGKEVYENEDLVQYPEVWKKIHAHLEKFGFILRYPGGANGTVDYSYEPWHIRYVGLEAAKEMGAVGGKSLEEYLGE